MQVHHLWSGLRLLRVLEGETTPDPWNRLVEERTRSCVRGHSPNPPSGSRILFQTASLFKPPKATGSQHKSTDCPLGTAGDPGSDRTVCWSAAALCFGDPRGMEAQGHSAMHRPLAQRHSAEALPLGPGRLGRLRVVARRTKHRSFTAVKPLDRCHVESWPFGLGWCLRGNILSRWGTCTCFWDHSFVLSRESADSDRPVRSSSELRRLPQIDALKAKGVPSCSKGVPNLEDRDAHDPLTG